MNSSFNLSKKPLEKCLFLWLNSKEFYALEATKRGVDVAQVYKQVPTFFRAIRRLQIELGIPFISPWIASWKKNMNNYDTIIIHSSKINIPVVRYINKTNPKVRIIVWYWNPVDKNVSVKAYDDLVCEKWSFDEADCKKYNLNYNTQYYFNNITLPDHKTEYDVVFVGGDKGRIKSLMELKKQLENMEISSYFHITATGKVLKEFKKLYKKRITYLQILDFISRSQAILDYVSEKQTGLTIRPLEALFLKKKLITNDKTIINRDFYNKQNIFILGYDDIESLPGFLSSSYINIDQEIEDKYDFDHWFSRFF